MKVGPLGHISLLALISVTGCSATVDSSEATVTAAQAVTASSGVTASVTKMSVNGQAYTATVTVTNDSKEPIYNWQVGMNFHTGAFITGQASGADATLVAGVPIFTPQANTATIKPGASYSFTFNGKTTGSDYTPTVATVDGVAPGTALAGNAADGVDPISRAAATAAVNVGYEYESHKKGIVDGDPNYHQDSGLILDSHAYRLAAGNATIEFDPDVPGYAYIPDQAMAQLAFAQQDPAVASYLTTGLASCFQEVNSSWVYAFHTGLLAITFPGGGSGVFNASGQVDNWTTRTADVGGTMELNVTMTSTDDSWFGILTYANMNQFTNYNSAVNAKYATNGQTASCSPFNGPGGSTNPYFVISLNGSSVAARYQGVGTNCQNGCKATAVLDPVPYSEPGAYYDINNDLVGPQPNPFAIVSTSLYANSSHAGQWGSRVVNGTQEWGTFSQAVTLFGTTEYKYVKQM